MNRKGQQPDPSLPTTTTERSPGSHPLDDAVAEAVTAALAHPPAVAVPGGFALAVARRAALQRPPQPLRRIGWAPRLAILSGALLTAAMFALAPHTPASLSSLRFDAELLLLGELGGLALIFHRLLPQD